MRLGTQPFVLHRKDMLRCIETKNETPVSRLAAVAAVFYQIRCNLIHGSKDPQVERDRILVAESLNILWFLVPALKESCLAAA